MVDSVVTWAKEYKVDGFRFDLMGHHTKANMLRCGRRSTRSRSQKDGVDGTKIYLYGEGWNFGEVADDARFVQATQANMAGTGIGTFNDRCATPCAAAGRSTTDPRVRASARGLLYDPNGVAGQRRRGRSSAAGCCSTMDQIRVGLAGNLARLRASSTAMARS